MASTAPATPAGSLNGAKPREPGGSGSRPPHSVSPPLPPGPRAPAIAQTVAWALAPTWLLDQCAKRIGQTFTLTFAPSGLKLVMVSDPEDVRTVFTAPAEIAPSATGTSPVAPIMGPNSVLTLTGEAHMRQRKLLLPPFHGERMREYEDVIVQATRRDMESWPIGEPMRLQEHTRRITLEVILRAVFGVEAERMEELRSAIAGLMTPLHPLAVLLFSLRRPSLDRPTGALGRSLDRLDAVVYAELERRRSQEDLAERTDILSLLMQARDEDGRPMTDPELRDELVTLLLAGHETTSTSVAWAVERLVRHPEKLRRLIDEVDAAADGGGDEYMTAVVNETLRVRPVVPIVARMLRQDMQVGPHLLPAGTRVMPNIYLTNRNPRVYEDPAEFRPERFLDEPPGTFSWIPFGGGIRRCIGASFAVVEMKLILRTALSELEPSVPEGARMWRRGEWVRRRAITLVPAAGTRVVWHRRSRTAG
ncbi:MAG: cytochrome P450 [Solirubrobacteraceae bacterium]